ncbi:MAG: M20/M25/M40 family metallo-hydrolase [Actinomycetota bacterium]|nr:M20/M25/M40 family metallo-hydrolase [Actinomycetota bacterium]MDQ3356665.1 M20/M25/M40 family metallo-hydrolase [Actinomycetota bacterium]
MTVSGVEHASAEERRRLRDDFVRLCETESPSRSERGVADAITAELNALGLEVEEDRSAAQTGADAGNLLARIPGRGDGARTILLCAHMDTVPLAAPVEVVLEGGFLRNRHEAILGADNKVAVATMLAVARRLARERARASVELLFTTCEERALAGAKAFDRSRLRADHGFVFDHASPVGELILAAPTYYGIAARFRGQAAHAGLSPEAGRSAVVAAASAIARLRLGRLDDETTANAGRIEGGVAANVVPEHCRVELEARSLDRERAGALVTEILDVLTDAAGAGECDLETEVEESFRGYRLTRTAEPVEAAAAALADLRIEPTYRSTASGSDAAVFNAAGLPCLNVADGSEDNHRPDERVSVEALETVLDLALGIVARSA